MLTPAQRLRAVLWSTIVLGLIAALLAIRFGLLLPLVAASLGLSYVAVRLLRVDSSKPENVVAPSLLWDNDPADMNALIETMLQQGRYSLLLRPQLAPHLSAEQLERAHQAQRDRMAFLEPSDVVLGALDDSTRDGDDAPRDHNNTGTLVDVPAIFLDRFPVTNADFQQFVRAGGYQQMAIWDPQIWPAVAEFLDTTGQPGPRFWKQGRFLPGEQSLPVVGLNWYEASAFARWLGKRLPSDAEWVRAAAWPVFVSNEIRLQRRFPWGDTFDPRQANLGGSGGKLTSVDHHPSGANPAGIEQLIGNAWEWMAGDYTTPSEDGWEVVLPCALKSLRGGAFDTYVENQATAHFASGENPVARKHNIGFRCAVSALDFLPLAELSDSESQSTINPSTVVPVELATSC